VISDLGIRLNRNEKSVKMNWIDEEEGGNIPLLLNLEIGSSSAIFQTLIVLNEDPLSIDR
jgi:hypothetical protein